MYYSSYIYQFLFTFLMWLPENLKLQTWLAFLAHIIFLLDRGIIVKVAQSHPNLCDPHGLYSPWNSPDQNTGMGSLSLFQDIFPTQRPNPGLWHCRRIVHQLRYQGSPRILEWVAYPFSSGSSRPRNRTRVSCFAGRFFTNWANSEDPRGLIGIYT